MLPSGYHESKRSSDRGNLLLGNCAMATVKLSILEAGMLQGILTRLTNESIVIRCPTSAFLAVDGDHGTVVPLTLLMLETTCSVAMDAGVDDVGWLSRIHCVGGSGRPASTSQHCLSCHIA